MDSILGLLNIRKITVLLLMGFFRTPICSHPSREKPVSKNAHCVWYIPGRLVFTIRQDNSKEKKKDNSEVHTF